MREEGAVGGSVAGSTAGWWPSDRDRFPPRFLLPPSLQTHNCIISTHLASSPLAPPPGPVAAPLPSRSLSPSFSVRSFSSSVNPPLRLPLGPILCALAPLSSLVRSFVRPTDRPLLCPPLCLSSSRRHHHPPRLLCSFARKRCHTRETAHRLFIPAPLLSLAHRSATRAQLRAVRLFSTVLSFPLSHLAKQRSCRVFASSFFLLLSPRHRDVPRLPRLFFSVIVIVVVLLLVLLFFFFVYLVVRSVIGPAIPPGGHTTIYPTRRRGQSAGGKDGARR